MTRALARVTATALAVLAAALLSLALFAGPAAAAEEPKGDKTEQTGFGSGQGDGMLLAAAAGVLMGFVVFSMSSPGQIHRAEAHH